MKYIQKTSALFSPLERITTSFPLQNEVEFYKGVHELEGQTYLLKKIRVFLTNDEDIKDHPVYQEVLMVKDNALPVDIRYVNSWVELDQDHDTQNPNHKNGVYVKLCLQMRYINNSVKLVKDLLLWSLPEGKKFDEDTLYDMAEEICDNVSLTNIHEFTAICAKFACQDTLEGILLSPQSTEQQTWNICYNQLVDCLN